MDEAEAAGASRVTFSAPVVGYVENFLHFPVGTSVPLGAYDFDRDAWEPSDSGLIVEIVSTDDGEAGIDTDGDGAADDDATLTQLGFSDAERRFLAEEYAPEDTLWRYPISHFSSWDCNWPFGPPDDATPPSSFLDLLSDLDCKNRVSGSIIGCEDQTLGEDIGIVGTPYTLHYQSERTPGRTDNRHIVIHLSGDTVPASLKRIELQVEVLGKRTTQSFDPAPNAQTTFVWDGLDPYGRQWQGRQLATVRVGYVYDGSYQKTDRFGYSGSGVPMSGDRTRQEVTLWKVSRAYVGGFDATPASLGGWTISAQHTYDTQGKVVYYGNGRRRAAEQISDVITTVVGNGTSQSTGDGGLATEASIDYPHGLVVAGDGSVYVAEDSGNRVRRVNPDGTISTYAGTGVRGFSGDEGPATEAELSRPMGLALGKDGTLYLADAGNHRVRSITPDGVIHTIAGGGNPASGNGDGGSATDAILSSPHALAFGPDGALYIGDNSDQLVRRIAPDGTISTYAGTGTCGDAGDGGPAVQASICDPLGLTVAPSGELFLTDWTHGRVRKIDTNGLISTVLGGGGHSLKEGSQATDVIVTSPHTVALGPEGALYVTLEGQGEVVRVVGDGTVQIVAGPGRSNSTDNGDNGPPAQASFEVPRVVFVHQDGSIWIADFTDARIRRVTPPLPEFARGEVPIASEGGSVLDVFDDHGRHLRTVDALTGLTLLDFKYDSDERLTSIKDLHGNTTTIAYDREGQATSITAPFGQETALSIGADGYLTSVTDPSDETVTLSYADGGLLTSLTEPRGPRDEHQFEYDELGRLTKDTEPSGSFQSLARSSTADAFLVAHTTKLGRTRTYQVQPVGAGGSTRTITQEDGSQLIATLGFATSVLETPISTTTVTYGGDPRFGMQVPLASSVQIKPKDGSATSTIQHLRSVQLANPQDPLSVQLLTDTISVNGRVFQSTWDADSRIVTTLSPAGRKAVTTYNALGQPVAHKVGDLAPTTFAYDSRGRLLEASRGTRTTTFSYDSSGWLSSVTNALGLSMTLNHDANGRVVGLTEPDDSALLSSFDANGNLLSLTPPGSSAHEYSYAPGNLLDSYAPPSLSEVPDSATSYGYNGDDQIATVTRPDGSSIATTYDSASGRVAQLLYADGSLKYAYSASTYQLYSITAPDAETTYSYQGNLLELTRWHGPFAASYRQLTNADLQLASDTAAGSSIAYTYDQDGLVTSAGTESLVHASQTALITETTLASVSDSYGYDAYGDLASYQAGYQDSPLYDVQLSRDDLGRIVAREETIQDQVHRDSFAYDSRGRLAQVTHDGATTTYTYDRNGNRTRVETAQQSETATFDAQDRLLTAGTTSCEYSPNGELIDKTIDDATTTLAYNGLGLLKKVVTPSAKTIEYLLDGEGRRIGKKIDGELTQGWIYRDALAPVATLNPDGTLQQRYVYASRPQVPDYIVQGDDTYRIIADERGSVRLVVNATSGEVRQRIDYDAWGAITNDTNPGFQPFAFAGGLYDKDTGLVHFGARDYDPSLGRFIAKDPSGLAGGLNVYVYAANDPINFIDSDGHFAILVPIAVGALAGALDGAAFGIAVSLATSGCVDWGDVGTSAVVGGVLGGISGGVGGWLAGGAAGGSGPKLLTAGSRVPNAGGRIISFLTQEQRTFYRVFSGDSRVGSFLTSVKPRSSAFAHEALALPPGNQATFVQEVIVPAGTRLQRSRALPAFGRRGGAEQFELLEHIPVENFGAGVPLP